MLTLIQFFIGVLSGFIFVLVARRAGARREARVYALALIVAAFIYVGFAVVGGASLAWLALELVGLAFFSMLALLGLRYSLWMAFGWAAHAVWDVALDAVLKVGFVPGWYPVVCIGFDLFLALYLVWQVRKAR
ncbi:MAG TPA: DUF6010 family protein [Pyrinomonadaceae bacterium]|nr:DUF6010 family protein [Pyrinomonadaceae bacterium]